jgi:hypothetical protein
MLVGAAPPLSVRDNLAESGEIHLRHGGDNLHLNVISATVKDAGQTPFYTKRIPPLTDCSPTWGR